MHKALDFISSKTKCCVQGCAHHTHLSQHSFFLCVGDAPPPPALSASIRCHCPLLFLSWPKVRGHICHPPALTGFGHFLGSCISAVFLLSQHPCQSLPASFGLLASSPETLVDFSFLYPEGHWHPTWFSESLLNGTLARCFL